MRSAAQGGTANERRNLQKVKFLEVSNLLQGQLDVRQRLINRYSEKQRGSVISDCRWEMQCEVCGKKYVRFRTLVTRHKRTFCSQKCYHSVRRQIPYKPWREGQRRARRIVAKYFALQPQHVVHHEDKDNRNNELSNLRVFANQRDHVTYHHGITTVVPIWDGRTVTP